MTKPCLCKCGIDITRNWGIVKPNGEYICGWCYVKEGAKLDLPPKEKAVSHKDSQKPR